MKKSWFLIFLAFIMTSCGGDDICSSTESTPRMKMKFKNEATGKIRSLDSIFVYADYGQGMEMVVANRYKTDSILIPLRIDNTPFTQLEIALSSGGAKSGVKIAYLPKDEYVSPACGMKKVYENVNAILMNPQSLKGVEVSKNEIYNEDNTHIFLLF